MRPKDHRIFIEGISEEIGVHPSLVDQFVSFYYARVRKALSELAYPRVYVEGLGTFNLRKKKLEKTIKKNKDILGNLEKMTFKGYDKHIAVKEKLEQMESVLSLMEEQQKEKLEWRLQQVQKKLENS